MSISCGAECEHKEEIQISSTDCHHGESTDVAEKESEEEHHLCDKVCCYSAIPKISAISAPSLIKKIIPKFYPIYQNNYRFNFFGGLFRPPIS